MTFAEKILAEANARIERGKKEREEAKVKREAEWEAKQRASQEAFQKKMNNQNNDLICRAFGVTPEWCRKNGINM